MKKNETLFEVNTPNVRLHDFIPKHNKAEDAVRGGELQLRNVRILPSAAAAILLAEPEQDERGETVSPGVVVERAFFMGDPPGQRFWGINEVTCTGSFKNRHTLQIDDLDAREVVLVDKIRLRFEAGPQKLIWADFSVHIEEPDADELLYYNEMQNRDVEIVLKQHGDLVDEMIANARGMAVTTTMPENHELDLDKAKRDGDQLNQAAEGLSQPETPPTKRAVKKAAKKRARGPKNAA